MQLARTWAASGGGYPRYAHSDLQNLTHRIPSLKLMGANNFLMAVLASSDIFISFWKAATVSFRSLAEGGRNEKKPEPTKAI